MQWSRLAPMKLASSQRTSWGAKMVSKSDMSEA